MFFLIRCAFWLTIVFHAMTWPPGSWPAEFWSPAPSAQAGVTQDGVMKMASDAAGTLASAAGTRVAAKLEEGCLRAPAECLALAGRLPQIVAINQTGRDISSAVLPKRPAHLADSETGNASTAHKALAPHN